MTAPADEALNQDDFLDPARAAAFQISMGGVGTLQAGDPLPPFFHQLYFWTPHAPDELGRDGHPRRGGIIPEMGLPRRMWAGGRLRFDAPLIAGRAARKTTYCDSHARKEGRSGPLGFVTLRHEITQNGQLCVTEWQDLVYRQDPDPNAPQPDPPQAPDDEESCATASYSSTLLFRYSALTFNGHRIHYDLDYARAIEGYRGLIVHGPLLAQQLMLIAEAELGPLERFKFRATSPLTHLETAELCRKGRKLWVRGVDGRLCMSAEA